MLSVIGLLGAFIVTYSNIPQIWLFIKQGHADGISRSSTWIGLVGVALRTIYLGNVTQWDPNALIPYYFALLCIIITLFYCYFPKKKSN